MALTTGARGGLRSHLIDNVFGGRKNIFSTLCITATGTGLGSVVLPLGCMVLDSSSSKWFLNKSTAAGGTWVQVSA
jgi:hypothetical protein